LENKPAKRENKPKKSKDSTKNIKVSETLSRIAFQTDLDLQSKINELKKSHQKIYNLDEFYTDINFLVSCYLMIKGKAGNMSPGTSTETLDGIDLA
jgi:hypothetical protein